MFFCKTFRCKILFVLTWIWRETGTQNAVLDHRPNITKIQRKVPKNTTRLVLELQLWFFSRNNNRIFPSRLQNNFHAKSLNFFQLMTTTATKTTKRLTSRHNQVKYFFKEYSLCCSSFRTWFFCLLTEEKHFIEYEDSEDDVEIRPLLRKLTPIVPDTICFHCNKPVPEGAYHYFVDFFFFQILSKVLLSYSRSLWNSGEGKIIGRIRSHDNCFACIKCNVSFDKEIYYSVDKPASWF
jgi:hypothetical protein